MSFLAVKAAICTAAASVTASDVFKSSYLARQSVILRLYSNAQRGFFLQRTSLEASTRVALTLKSLRTLDKAKNINKEIWMHGFLCHVRETMYVLARRVMRGGYAALDRSYEWGTRVQRTNGYMLRGPTERSSWCSSSA
jgi:hypothetical protein